MDFRVEDWLIRPGLNIVSRNGASARLEPKAMEVLKTVAKGAPDAWLTIQAQNALDRVERRERP